MLAFSIDFNFVIWVLHWDILCAKLATEYLLMQFQAWYIDSIRCWILSSINRCRCTDAHFKQRSCNQRAFCLLGVTLTNTLDVTVVSMVIYYIRRGGGVAYNRMESTNNEFCHYFNLISSLIDCIVKFIYFWN